MPKRSEASQTTVALSVRLDQASTFSDQQEMSYPIDEPRVCCRQLNRSPVCSRSYEVASAANPLRLLCDRHAIQPEALIEDADQIKILDAGHQTEYKEEI